MKTVIIDNYDSFTYNLVHYLEEILGDKPNVIRNNEFELDELDEYDILIISPGPGLPKNAGKLMDILKLYVESKIIFGVCLGLQALAEHFGGTLKNLNTVHHGISHSIDLLNDDFIYKDVKNYNVGRYHSWTVDTLNFPECLTVTSVDKSNEIMSFKHKNLPIHAVQFHPESIMTIEGKKMLRNFFEHYVNIA